MRAGWNIEGVVWDPRSQALLFGQRGPAETGQIAVVRVPVDAGAAPWETSSLEGAVHPAHPHSEVGRCTGNP